MVQNAKKGSVLQLRPHHSLCMQFFVGKGYSEEFTRYMYECLSMPESTPVIVTTSLDSLCGYCPNHPNGVCTSAEKVDLIDRNTMAICGFDEGDSLTLGEFHQSARQNIINNGLLKKVCGDCSFLSICLPLAEKMQMDGESKMKESE